MGANNGTAQSLLKQEYKDEITVEEAVGLVMRTMSKTMDSTTLGSEKREFRFRLVCLRSSSDAVFCVGVIVEFATLTLDPTTGQPKAKIYKPAEVDALLQKHDLGKKDEDTEMRG